MPRPDQIVDGLAGVFRGGLHFDGLTRSLYAADASLFQVTPLGVACPRDEEDVQALAAFAHEHRLPLVPRGAGTSPTGASLGGGLVVDFARHMNAVVSVGPDAVRAQPGVTWEQLNRALAARGREFAPEPATAATRTLGGLIAVNPLGATAHGRPGDHLESCRVVWDSGQADRVGREPADPRHLSPRGRSVLRNAWELLRTAGPPLGCAAEGVLQSGRLGAARLMAGSEGTLGLITELTLRTRPVPGGRRGLLFAFTRTASALTAARLLRESAPARCELLDRRVLAMAPRCESPFADAGLADAESALVVELERPTGAEAAADADRLIDKLRWREGLADAAAVAGRVGDLRRFRAAAEAALLANRSGRRPVPVADDVTVPVNRLGDFLAALQDDYRALDVTGVVVADALAGHVRARPLLDPSRPDDADKLWGVAERVFGRVTRFGGRVGTRFGLGLAVTPWAARLNGPSHRVNVALKEIFDPTNILNPGKVIAPDPDRPAWPLRPPTPQAKTPLLVWPAGVAAELDACNGCGACRSPGPTVRMCPMARGVPGEVATPRAKARLLRAVLSGEELPAADVRSAADLCVQCKMCRVECPTRADVPKLMAEAKAADNARRGLRRADWAMARLEALAALGSSLAPVANALLGGRAFRWLLEKLLGVSRRRCLPRFAWRPFLSRAARHGWTRKPRAGSRPRLAYFADVFANYNDPTVGEAAVRVLRHQGFEVYVPPGQRGGGMAPFAVGDVASARRAARRNVQVLADLVREGYRVVCSEPTAAVMLMQDYPNLLDDPDARLVAGRTVELTALLGELRAGGQLRADFRRTPADIGHHVPCHLKALGTPPAAPGLLAMIPDARVRTVDVGCSGMAGGFGLRAENYERSLEIGRPVFAELNRPGVLAGSSECSACRLQMQEGTGKRALHPAQYLAIAYGLMPELAGRLREPLRGLIG